MSKTLAARYYEPKKPVRLEEMDVPEVADDEVLIDVKASGICHSDLHIINGDLSIGVPPPLTLGHEASGLVEAVGKGVKGFQTGDRVMVDYDLSCGRCVSCLAGKDNLCDNFKVMAANAEGSWKGKVVIPVRHVHTLPGNVPFAEGAIVACALMTSYHAAKFGGIFAGSSILVYGLGGVGINLVQWGRLFGATEVVVVDMEEGKLKLAREKGATVTINPKDGDVVKRIREATSGGVDLGFEVIGKVETERNTLESVRKGGRAVMVGICGEKVPVSVFNDLQVPEVTMMSPQDHLKAEVPQVLKFLETGRFDISGVVTHKLPLKDANVGIDMLNKRIGNPGRIVLEP